MCESKFFIKGDPKEMTSRIKQVHTITLFCPLYDAAVQKLKENFEKILPGYKKEDNYWMNVPSLDVLSVFTLTEWKCRATDLTIDMRIISVFSGALSSFPNLKYINFEFRDDDEITNLYKNKLAGKKVKGDIYKVEVVELNFSNMFSQEIIDGFNKILMMNEIVPNSYLDREFNLTFNYDDYVAFINMFLSYNGEILKKKDPNVCDYFSAFPSKIVSHKPYIKVVTNYAMM